MGRNKFALSPPHTCLLQGQQQTALCAPDGLRFQLRQSAGQGGAVKGVAAFCSLTLSAAAADAVSAAAGWYDSLEALEALADAWQDPGRTLQCSLTRCLHNTYCCTTQASANGLQLLPVGSRKGRRAIWVSLNVLA